MRGSQGKAAAAAALEFHLVQKNWQLPPPPLPPCHIPEVAYFASFERAGALLIPVAKTK
jgi:hypothetical protein